MALRSLPAACFSLLGAALLTAATVAHAGAVEAKPLSDLGRASLHTLGIVQGPATTEIQVYAFANYVRGGMRIESTFSRDYAKLFDIDKLDLHGLMAQALERRLAAQPASLSVRELPMPSGARGIYQAAQRAEKGAEVDGVLSFFVRAGYAAFKPEMPYLPFVAVRVVLIDPHSGRTLYDDDLSAGPAGTAEGAVQVQAALPNDGAVALAALNADPAQAAKAWQVQIEAIAERLARELTGLPPVPVPSGLNATIDTLDNAPALMVDGKPLQAQLGNGANTAGAQELVVRLPAFKAPYVLTVAGKLDVLPDKRWRLLTPTVILLDDKRQVTRVLTGQFASVRGERTEQQFTVKGANEAYAIVRPSPQPPMARWLYMKGEIRDLITIKQGTALDLSGPMPMSNNGPVEVSAKAIEGAAP